MSILLLRSKSKPCEVSFEVIGERATMSFKKLFFRVAKVGDEVYTESPTFNMPKKAEKKRFIDHGHRLEEARYQVETWAHLDPEEFGPDEPSPQALNKKNGWTPSWCALLTLMPGKNRIVVDLLYEDDVKHFAEINGASEQQPVIKF
jgi:hypothetical protein